MIPRAELLARRRERLVLRSAALRRRAVAQSDGLQPALNWANRLQDGWRWLRGNPLTATATTVALAAWRPARLLGLGWRAWSAWRLFRRLRDGRNTPPAGRRR